jgi:hypothetical protein
VTVFPGAALRTFRHSPAVWLALPVVLMGVFYSGDVGTSGPPALGGVAAYSAGFGISPLGGALAAFAAWETGRLRAGQVWRQTPARGRYRVAWSGLLPVTVTALAADVAVLAAACVRVGAVPGPGDLPDFGMAVATQVALMLVGAGLGSVLHRGLAVPLALAGAMLWLMVPPSLATPWPRYLTGMPLDSPTPTDVPAPHVLLAPVLLAAGITAGVLLAASPVLQPRGSRGRRLLRPLVAVAVTAAAAFPAYALVRNAGYDTPMVPRAGDQTCAGEAPVICVPSEMRGTIPVLRDAAKRAVPGLVSVGLDRPRRIAYVSRQARTEPGTWRVYVQEPLSGQQALAAVAEAGVPAEPRCPALPDDMARPSPRPLRALLLLAAGVDRATVRSWEGPAALATAEKEEAKSLPARRRWLRSTRAALASCDRATLERAEHA